MKRLLVVVTLLGMSVLAAPAASADAPPGGLPCTPTANGNGSATCTLNAHPITLPFFAGACAPAVTAGTAITGNAVFHVIGNTAGDFWITTTNEGTFVGLPTGYSGRATQWFGDENNANNQVVHAISEGSVTFPDGSATSFHETFHFSVSASGQQSPVVFDTCTN